MDKVEPAEAKVEAGNRAHNDKALVKAKLQRVSLQQVVLGSGPAAIDRVIETDGKTIVTGGWWTSCPDRDEPEYVQQGTTIYRVVWKPITGKHTKLAVCTCDMRPRGCGRRPDEYYAGYVLPKGTTWGGPLEVETRSDTISITWAVQETKPCGHPPYRK